MLNDSSNNTKSQERRDELSPPSAGRFGNVVGTIVSGFVLYLVPPFVATAFILLAFAVLGASTGNLQQWITDGPAGQFWYILITEILVMGLLLWFMKQTGETWRTIAATTWGNKTARYTIIGFISYYALYLAVAIGASMVLPLDFEQRQELGFDTTSSGVALVFAFVSLVVLPPLVEEIVFRGYLYTRLRRSLSVVAAALIISIVFSLAHLQFGSGNPLLWVAALDTFVLSMVLVWLREKTGAIWAGVGVHALKNGLAFFLLFNLGM